MKGESEAMTPTEQQTLYALYCFSRDTRHISAATLATALSITPTQAASALVVLERKGLVDASRARLTMLGLASAVRLGPAAGGPRLDLCATAVAAPRPVLERVPVAARSLRPEAPSIGGHGASLGPLS